MSRIWMPGGGGSGADLDVITADASDLLAGKVTVGPDGEPLTGMLALTGTEIGRASCRERGSLWV